MARTRRAPLDPGALPPELAAGPTHPAWSLTGNPDDVNARSAWYGAGRAWSLEALGTVNGWMRLVPDEVWREQSAKERARRMRSLVD